ncbi:actin cytoskeleton-regulatory complex protein PAN1 isoform X8 [Helianthus annuus]|uniref:actin cytoskeleton-regulatory complex protein PAN1 isoform X8 n=1 Tax=Helianthus annuus TaxID=4232 RepID=UPI001652BA17|nr:actin cytoskeleton-regulatory complex protein PAN1 isoform X8 [Helianthus annuus]
MISFLSSIRHPPSPNTTSTSPVTHPHHLSVATTHTTHLRRRSPTTVLLLHPEPQSPSDTSSAAHSHHHRQVAALNHHPSTSPSSDKIFQFNGANSNIQEMAKALEVIQFLKDKYHEGTCNVGDDGKLQAEGDSSEFWVIFGGFAPIGKRVLSDDDVIPKRTPGKLYSIFQFSSQDKSTNHSPSQSRWFNSCCNPSTYKFTRPKSTGVPLPPAGPALFVPPPPPKVLPPAADSPDLPPSPSGSMAATPTPSEKSQDDLHEPDPRESKPVAPDASAPTPTAPQGPPVGSGIRPVLTPATSTSNQLHCSPPIVLLLDNTMYVNVGS